MKRLVKLLAIVLVALMCVSSVSMVCSVHSEAKAVTKKKTNKIRLNSKNIKLIRNGSKQLKVIGVPARKVKWKSLNKTVASVSKKGVVRGKRRGSTKIVASFWKNKRKCVLKCKVNVIKAKKRREPRVISGYATISQGVNLLDAKYKKNENIIVSPTSLNMALGMVANSTSDDATAECEKYLGTSINSYNDYANEIREASKKGQGQLKIANSFWYRDKYNIMPNFQKRIVNYYGADIYKKPFDDSTVKDINKWANDKTDGMIPEILQNIDKQEKSIILNALLFDGKWEIPFEKYNIQKKDFTCVDKSKKTVELMSGNDDVYYENQYAVAFEKNYMDGYKFIGILPKEEGDFSLEDLHIDSLLFSRDTKHYTVSYSIPKFEYKWEDNLDDYLKNTNLSILFKSYANPVDKAIGIGNIPEPLYVTKIRQSCAVSVNKEGTKAAAVTIINSNATSVGVETKRVQKSIVLDRPFAYIIMDKNSKEALFVGKVVNIGK